MRLLILILPTFLLSTLAGCAPQAMNYAISSRQNRQVTAVIASWGKPSEELKLEGKHILLWNSFDGVLAQPNAKRPALKPEDKYCIRLLEADRNGRIIYGTWEGNDCPGWFSGWHW